MENRKYFFRGFFRILLLLLLVGCSSDDDQGEQGPVWDGNYEDYFIRFDADGVRKNFSFTFGENGNPLTTVWGSVGEDENGGSAGSVLTQVQGHSFSLLVISLSQPIETGILFTDDNSFISGFYNSETNESGVLNDMQVEWTEITAEEVKGIFSGSIDMQGNEVLEITNGEFFLARVEAQ